MEVFVVIVVFAICVSIVMRLLAGGMDRDRVCQYIRDRGGELIDSQWAPFGRGWYGEKNERIYEVRYRDSLGNVHEASVKTSLWSGVYFTDDKIVQESGEKSEESRLRELEMENSELRKRISELEEKE